MKRAVISFSAIALTGLLYYLFVVPSEFSVRFISRTTPGDIIKTVRIWNRSLKDATILDVDSFESLSQRIVHEGREYIYKWKFTRGDSVTNVRIDITEPGRRIQNKALVPFTDRPIERAANDLARGFYNVLKAHLDITRVNIIGLAEVQEKFCICSFIQASQLEKGNGMMREFMPLSTFVDEANLATDGPPVIKIHHWSHQEDVLEFDFCFPLKQTVDMPDPKIFTYKTFPAELALKAEYFGNYITSDRAWYELIQFAADNGYQITGLPTEVFHNNPNLGINEKEWKADVFLPVAAPKNNK